MRNLEVGDAPDVVEERHGAGARPLQRLMASRIGEGARLLKDLHRFFELAHQFAQVITDTVLDGESQHVGTAVHAGDSVIGS
ncbi:hypothetical protein D3C85_1738130 [compost metagenome]